jgi:hypothetical protein
MPGLFKRLQIRAPDLSTAFRATLMPHTLFLVIFGARSLKVASVVKCHAEISGTAPTFGGHTF